MHHKFKKNRKARRQGTLNWLIPKRLRKDSEVVDYNPAKSGKKPPRLYCRKLKGKHDYILEGTEQSLFIKSIIHYYKCSGCGRQKSVYHRA